MMKDCDKLKTDPEFLVWKMRDQMALSGVMENPVTEQFCLVHGWFPLTWGRIRIRGVAKQQVDA